ncbi:MAG: hypothetical protein KAS75_05910 [Planctomycetes bacterium]|nr:hypothetical protein [Planctomycetota bacterium]
MSKKLKKLIVGFTIIELLVGLAITAMLLTAVAVALNASIINYRENEDIFKTINTARQALFRITTQLRTADAVNPASPENECAFTTADGDNITYQYNDTDNKLYVITDSGTYVLCGNVTAMTFKKITAIQNGTVCVKNVQISITVVNGNAQQTISAAVVIRRNLL